MGRVPPANLSPRYHRQWQRETSRWPREVAGDGWDAVAGFGTCAHRQMRCFPQRRDRHCESIGRWDDEGKNRGKTELGPEVPKRTKTDKNVTVEAEVVFKLLFFFATKAEIR